MDNLNRPKLGLALSGAAARSVFYIGFLEVLQENQIHIDYISANSGACIVAAAFACGTLSELKEKALSMDKEFLFSIIQRSKDKGGLYSMDKVEEAFQKYTKGMNFEQVRPLMGFTCTNINSGEEIILTMGDIAKAISASCALPGIFKPVRWGQWDLVDGGLVSIVPGHAARTAGCDAVIGIYVSPKERVFNNFEIAIKKTVNFFYRLFGFHGARRMFRSFMSVLEKNKYFSYFYDLEEAEPKTSGMFEILGKAMDIAIKAQNKQHLLPPNFDCDFIIRPTLPTESAFKRLSYLYLADFSGSKRLYEFGRQTATSSLPRIKNLLLEKSKEL